MKGDINHSKNLLGARRQSEAATALWIISNFQRGLAKLMFNYAAPLRIGPIGNVQSQIAIGVTGFTSVTIAIELAFAQFAAFL